MNSSSRQQSTSTKSGLIAALLTYLIWGMFPIYMKVMAYMPVLEVIGHRMIWSVPVAGITLLVLRRVGDLKAALANPAVLRMACLTAVLITANWTIYTWAIMNNHAIDAALGYYINPLVNVLLGFIFLRERLMPVQWFSVMLACCAVVILAVNAGGLPWVALCLPLTFAFYGFFRKSMPIGPAQGFMLEATLMLPIALVYIGYLLWRGESHFLQTTLDDSLLLLLAGPLTAAPLILFATAAKKLNFATLGLMQYITPTMVFIMAVVFFKEPFSYVQLVAFALIWIGLVIYTISSIQAYRSLQLEKRRIHTIE